MRATGPKGRIPSIVISFSSRFLAGSNILLSAMERSFAITRFTWPERQASTIAAWLDRNVKNGKVAENDSVQDLKLYTIEKTVLDFYIDEREVFRVWEMNGYPRKLILDGDYRKQQMLPVIIISRSTSRVKWIPWKR